VLCVDEKSQIQALDRSVPMLPLMPGVPARQTHDYVRNGTTNLYAALDVASGNRDRRDDAAPPRRGVPALLEPGRHVGAGGPRRARRARQLLDAQDAVDPALAAPPPALHISLHPDLQLLAQPHRALVRRADHTKWIKRGTHRSVRDLVASIRTWITDWNDDPKPFVWNKTADQILDSLAAYCQRINDSGH
jgi:hypothetical protein